MYRITICLLVTLLGSSAPAQIPAGLQFEVASLKPSHGNAQGGGIRPARGGERYEARNCPIKLMIQVAYGVKAEQIVGGPSWLDTDRHGGESREAFQYRRTPRHVDEDACGSAASDLSQGKEGDADLCPLGG